jgi:manganese-dependent inorganic pyrophosphatase
MRQTMTTLVFGHKSPDTDSTGSPIIWAWYLNEVRGTKAEAVLLGEPNTEAAFVIKHWDCPKPRIVTDIADGTSVVIVDTNNPAELPANINALDITAIIDHHKLVGGLETKGPIDITIRPLACTATIMHDLMGADAAKMPDWVKGLMLSCILSDTLEFRSPTTTAHDRALVESLARDLGINISDYAAKLFEAKSDVGAFSDAELLRMDSKEYNVAGKELRVSVLETTAPKVVLDRKASLMASMVGVAAEDGADQVLLFVIDILREEATLLVPNDLVKQMAEASFGVTVTGDTVVIPGLLSRKKQIIPALKL